MFSIIIPLYNKAPYIEKALCSIQAQTFREFEVIVIDDGSTDIAPQPPEGGVIGLAYSDIEKMLNGKGQLISQVNQGVSVARNNGVKLAKYPYICFLDADDWWSPTFLEEMKRLIEEFPEAGIYGTSYFKVKDGKHIPANIGVEDGFEQGVINYCKVYANTLWMPLWTGAVCIPKVIFDSEKGFKPNLKLGEDFDLWIRIAMQYPVVLLNRPLAYYNQDVDLSNRAVGMKFYKPEEHMLFTDYGEMMNNHEFRFLFERLALYGLLPYYLNGKNKAEVRKILLGIEDWQRHELKYAVYYKYLPKFFVKVYFSVLRLGSRLKVRINK